MPSKNKKVCNLIASMKLEGTDEILKVFSCKAEDEEVGCPLTNQLGSIDHAIATFRTQQKYKERFGSYCDCDLPVFDEETGNRHIIDFSCKNEKSEDVLIEVETVTSATRPKSLSQYKLSDMYVIGNKTDICAVPRTQKGFFLAKEMGISECDCGTKERVEDGLLRLKIAQKPN